ncbi:MAG: hypothetical protein HFJ05_05645 [Eubacterium sp.]|nr:hypothetical protein [Eubacterium sp.]
MREMEEKLTGMGFSKCITGCSKAYNFRAEMNGQSETFVGVSFCSY